MPIPDVRGYQKIKTHFQVRTDFLHIAGQWGLNEPQSIQVIIITPHYPQELIIKILLLTIPYTYLSHRKERNQAGTDLETSSLLLNFHSARKYYAEHSSMGRNKNIQ